MYMFRCMYPYSNNIIVSPPPAYRMLMLCPVLVLVQVTVTVCDGPPSPRANFTVTSLPTGDMILFGGECFDGQDTKCFNELFRCVQQGW